MNETNPMSAKTRLDSRVEAHRRNAIRITFIVGILLAGISAPGLFTIAPSASSQYAGNIITFVAGLLGLICAWVSYRHSATGGSLAFIASFLAISLGIPFYANGLGLQAGIIAAVIVIAIATATLESRLAVRISLAALIVEALVILMDFYLPSFGLEELESPYINPLLIIVLILFVFLIFRQFGAYTLRTKFVIAFVAVAMIAVSTLAYFVNRSNSVRLTQDVGESLKAQTETRALLVGATLSKELGNLKAFGLSKVVQDRVEAASASYTGDVSSIEAEIQRLDNQWRAADQANDDNDPLVAKVLNEVISSELREYRDTFPENVEVFVTDQYGANVAATNRTSDYYQGDEEWWQAAYNNGAGAIYIGQPAFDESASTYAANIAVPLYAHDTQRVVGVLRTTLDLKAISEILNTTGLGGTGKVELYVAGGQKITAEGGGIIPGDPNVLLLPADIPNYKEILFENTPSLVSRAPVASLDPNFASVIKELGWSLVSHRDREESLTQVTEQTRTIVLISMLLLGLAVIAAFYAAQILARPVQSLTAVAEKIASGHLEERAAITTQDEIGRLADAFNRMTAQLRDSLGSLERRVSERTSDAETARLLSERRAQELQSISEISRLISSEQRLAILLPLITRLVSERFDFYHVGIFFVDSARQFAILQAANSEGGRRMIERRHRLELGQSGIVGTVAQTGKPRIALDVGADAVYFNNPDLPNTRSEMSLPLNVRNQTVGVLDVQSVKPGAFTESDINTLGILADHIAISIDNARLFEQSQQAFGELQALYRQYQSQDWTAFVKQEARIGYHQSSTSGRALEEPLQSDEIRTVMDGGQALVTNEEDIQAEPSMVIPVKLRGQTIGVLNVKAPAKGRKWNQDEINLVQAVSDRLALALDNARLLQESQRRAAKEQKIGEVTARIGASINMRNVLQTAVEELGRALPGSEVIIQFKSEEDNHTGAA